MRVKRFLSSEVVILLLAASFIFGAVPSTHTKAVQSGLPEVTLSRYFGPPGTTITITATGFAEGGTVSVCINLSCGIPTVWPVGTNEWDYTITNYDPEPIRFEVQQTLPDSTSAFALFYTTIPLPPLIISPSSGPPGTNVTVTGTGFYGLFGSLYFDLQWVKGFTAYGSFSVNFTIPEGTEVGKTYTIEAWSYKTECVDYGPIICSEYAIKDSYSASGSFTVTSDPAITGIPLYSDILWILPMAILLNALVLLRRRLKYIP